MRNEDIDLPVIYFDRECHMIYSVSLYTRDEDVRNRTSSTLESA